jgi:hypothetical protein
MSVLCFILYLYFNKEHIRGYFSYHKNVFDKIVIRIWYHAYNILLLDI